LYSWSVTLRLVGTYASMKGDMSHALRAKLYLCFIGAHEAIAK
jgi:hypothetical protein